MPNYEADRTPTALLKAELQQRRHWIRSTFNKGTGALFRENLLRIEEILKVLAYRKKLITKRHLRPAAAPHRKLTGLPH